MKYHIKYITEQYCALNKKHNYIYFDQNYLYNIDDYEIENDEIIIEIDTSNLINGNYVHVNFKDKIYYGFNEKDLGWYKKTVENSGLGFSFTEFMKNNIHLIKDVIIKGIIE